MSLFLPSDVLQFVLPAVLLVLPPLWPCALGSLAVVLLLSGIDDFIPLLICAAGLWRERLGAGERGRLETTWAERRIAIFVPCWHEAGVIGNMVRHNLAAIRYRNYDFFLGVYPNDPATVRAAEQLAAEFGNVHVALCADPGPTSKADCLNSAYRGMQLFERAQNAHFDTVVLHDAEDLIHPQALALINQQRAHYDMVQVPVLPLPTSFSDLTHGVYCDEFAEFQTIDMRARQESGSFIPSNGVGTGFARAVLDRLAREGDGLVFDPGSLTEDYEIGVRIHALGYRQCFAPLQTWEGDFVATREYFPRSTHTAIRQRTRWITGIALQCWERQGWRGSWRTRYWFWRDRKGLITNPLSVVANALFVSGLFDYLLSSVVHRPWLFEIRSTLVAALCLATTVLQCFRLTLRGLCVGRIFGTTAALTVPLRSFHANLINCAAAIRAVQEYWSARRSKQTLAWQKTDHAYPERDSLRTHRRELAEILIGCGFISDEQMAQARRELETGSTLDLLLLANGVLNEEQLCKAMSLQSGLATARIQPGEISSRVMRSLPTRIEKRHGLLPIRVESGRLVVASSSVPSTAALKEVSTLSFLPVDFQLVTPSVYAKLRELVSNEQITSAQ